MGADQGAIEMKNKKMKIFITGGAGYVGSACLRHLVKKGYKVCAYDNLSQGHAAAVDGNPLIEGDLAEAGRLLDSLRSFQPDAVMHFAASTHVGESVEYPDLYYRNNVQGTLNLLNAMRDADVSRLLFSSTCAVYGATDADALGEEMPFDPVSPYARSKLAVEWIIRDFAAAYGLGFTILRYFNAAGACPSGRFGEAHDPETHLIPLVLRVPLGQRATITVFGSNYGTADGTCVRDYVHVDDLAQAHRLAVEAMTLDTAEVYNVGIGTGHSVREVILASEAVTGRSIPVIEAERRLGDPPRLVADSTKLQTRLGWQPCYTQLEDIIATAWAWHETHPEGYLY
jgi:UDP-glucose 4-epimerase